MLKRFAELVDAQAREREASALEVARLGGLTLEQARGLTRGEACLRLAREVAGFFREEGEGELAARFEALAARLRQAEDRGELPFRGACRAVEDAVAGLTRRWAAASPPVDPMA